MKILVTGGAGYIGSHFIKRALERNNEIIVIDNLSTGHKTAVPESVKFYESDIRDREDLRNILLNEKPDAVVHFAANSLVGESMEKPLIYFDNNTYGMVCLLETMKDADVKKIVFSSTAAVYGIPKTVPIKETDTAQPINPYGESKLQMEKIMNWADEAHGIKGVALRYFNVAGAAEDGTIGEDHNPETHLLPNILKAAINGGEISMFGNDYDTPDGYNVRDYVHPTDLADAHLLAIEYLERENKSNVFNLGSLNGYSVKQMVDMAERVIGKSITRVQEPRRSGDPDTLVADSTKARKILNWQPKYDNIESLIQTAWAWTKKHPNGFAD